MGVKFYGEGAAKKTERVYKKGVKVTGKIVKTLRYPGPYMSVNLTMTEERRRRRLTAGRQAWQALRGFLEQGAPEGHQKDGLHGTGSGGEHDRTDSNGTDTGGHEGA